MGFQTEELEMLRGKVEKLEPAAGLYLIILGTSEAEPVEIMPYWNFVLFPHKDAYIVGMAPDKENAKLVLLGIVDEIYQNTGDVRIMEYFKQ